MAEILIQLNTTLIEAPRLKQVECRKIFKFTSGNFVAHAITLGGGFFSDDHRHFELATLRQKIRLDGRKHV